MDPKVWNAAELFIEKRAEYLAAVDKYASASQEFDESREALERAVKPLAPMSTIAIEMPDSRLIVCHCDGDYRLTFSLVESFKQPI